MDDNEWDNLSEREKEYLIYIEDRQFAEELFYWECWENTVCSIDMGYDNSYNLEFIERYNKEFGISDWSNYEN